MWTGDAVKSILFPCVVVRYNIDVREYRSGNQKWTIQRSGNIGYSSGRKPNQKHNTTCVGHHYAQKTQITKIRHESSYAFCPPMSCVCICVCLMLYLTSKLIFYEILLYCLTFYLTDQICN